MDPITLKISLFGTLLFQLSNKPKKLFRKGIDVLTFAFSPQPTLMHGPNIISKLSVAINPTRYQMYQRGWMGY
jgi:hypothetical protein